MSAASDLECCAIIEGELAVEELILLLTYSPLSFEARWFAAWRLHAIRVALYVQRQAVGLPEKLEAAA